MLISYEGKMKLVLFVVLWYRKIYNTFLTTENNLRLLPKVIFLSTLFFSYSILNAQEPAKALAMEEAFAESKKEAQDVKNKPAEAAESADNDMESKAEFKKLPREAYRGQVEELITEVPKEEAMPFNIDSLIRYMPSRGVSAMPGTITVTVAESEASYLFKVFDKLPVEVSLYTEYTGIKNTTQVELPSHLTGLSTGIETTLPFFRFNKTYLRLKVSPSYYSDDWNFKSSAFRIPVQTFLIYQLNDKWTFVGGVAVYPDYEDVVWPIAGVIYKPNEKLIFNLVSERPNITYKLNDKLSLFTELGIVATSEYEVTKDNLKNVVLKYNESRLGIGAKYQFNKFIESSLSVGGAFDRYFKYRDSLGKVVVKDGFYSEFRVNVFL